MAASPVAWQLSWNRQPPPLTHVDTTDDARWFDRADEVSHVGDASGHDRRKSMYECNNQAAPYGAR